MNYKIRWFDLLRDVAIVMGLSIMAGIAVVLVYGVRWATSQDALSFLATVNKIAILTGFLIVGCMDGRRTAENIQHSTRVSPLSGLLWTSAK